MDATQQRLYDMLKRQARENEDTARRIEESGTDKDRAIVFRHLATELHVEAAKLQNADSAGIPLMKSK
jgi:hypothetical protein